MKLSIFLFWTLTCYVFGSNLRLNLALGKPTFDETYRQLNEVKSSHIRAIKSGKPSDFSGTWIIYEMTNEEDCGDGIKTYVYKINITQDKNLIEARFNNGDLFFTAMVFGNKANISHSYSEDLGKTTENGIITIADDAQWLSYESSWTWAASYSSHSCSGFSAATGKKVNPN